MSSQKGELHLGLKLSHGGEIQVKEEPSCGMEQKAATQQASPLLHLPSSIMIGSKGSLDLSDPKPVGTATNTKVDPLQLTVTPRVPTIDLNLPPSADESQVLPIPNNTGSGMETANPFEFPLLAGVVKKEPAFGPFILESSEVAKQYDQRQQREAAAAAADNNNKTKREEVDAGKRKVRRRYYRWPAKTVAKINKKIEQLKAEALRHPTERRSIQVIEADIDKLQAKKEEFHARACGDFE